MANEEQKNVAKKKVAKKVAAKKTASKKAASKKTVAKKTASKKTATKKAATKPAETAAAKKPTAAGRMRVTLVKSLIGTIGHHRDTVRGMGLRRLNHTVELEDTPATRGMVKKVQYLVRVEKD